MARVRRDEAKALEEEQEVAKRKALAVSSRLPVKTTVLKL